MGHSWYGSRLAVCQVDRRCILANPDPSLQVNKGFNIDLNIGEIFRTNIDSSATRIPSFTWEIGNKCGRRHLVRAGWNVNYFEGSFLVACVVQHTKRLVT